MVQLSANILFSGIGCQERGIQNSNLFDLQVLNTSEINKDSIITYASIHKNMTEEMYKTYTYPSESEILSYLKTKNIGFNTEKNIPFDWKRNKKQAKKVYLACQLNNNLGDISQIDSLPYADLWTCSFPCTDISLAGKQQGLSENSNTRSSLLWQNIRLLQKAKETNTLPKYILIENVKNLLSSKFKTDFQSLLTILSDLGFNTYYSVLNGCDCGIPQFRERIFMLCIRKDIDTKKFTFPQPFDLGIRLKDIIEPKVDKKYYLKDEVQETLFINEKQGGKDFKVRKLSALECFRLMGLNDTDYFKAKELGISESTFLKQLGNGIITNCVSLIFEHLYKAQYDENYICADELLSKLPNSENNKLMFIGGIKSHLWLDNGKLYSRNYKQGYRVYSEEGLACTLSSQGGGLGGNSGLYAITENKVCNPLKNKSPYGWHFEQEVYDINGIARTLKAGGGSGNVPKIIEYKE